MTDDEMQTVARTLWSDPAWGTVYESLRRQKSDSKIKKILRQVEAKDYKPDYILHRTGTKDRSRDADTSHVSSCAA